jgi:hypothetical protein
MRNRHLLDKRKGLSKRITDIKFCVAIITVIIFLTMNGYPDKFRWKGWCNSFDKVPIR